MNAGPAPEPATADPPPHLGGAMARVPSPHPGGAMAGVPLLRRATAGDAAAVAEVWLRSFTTALPTVRRAHTDDEVRGWFREVVVPTQEAWVAVTGDRVVGIMVLDGDFLNQLYLDPDWRGRGIGDRFVALARRCRPDGLQLWTFQVNRAAQRFYERHGFVAVEWTDGHTNEEHEPDARYVWQPTEPTIRK